jgi:hypothetical protein
VKTQILQLEPHDDANSTRDKMGWGGAGRILLIWPERGHAGEWPLSRRLDLVLLQRHSKRLGTPLALVTSDPQVRFHAGLLGIPVYRTLAQAQKATWRPPRHIRHRPERPALDLSSHRRPDLQALRLAARPAGPAWLSRFPARLGFFTLGVLALLAVAAVLAPGAEIRLDPLEQTQALNLDVEAGPQVEEVLLAGQVPTRQVQVMVEGRQSLRATGTVRVPTEAASGRVVLTNLTDTAIQVPEGTVVRTLGEPPIRFTTTRTGQLPAGPGQTVGVSIRAIRPGRSGNLPAGRLAAIEGPLGLSLAVTNPAPTTGGSDRPGPAPQAGDYEVLKTGLAEALRRTAQEELAGQLKTDDLLLPETLTLVRVVEETYTPREPQPSDWLELNLQLEFAALVVAGEDLRLLASGALDANLPEGFIPAPGSLQIFQAAKPNAGRDGLTHLRLSARRQIRAELSEARAASAVLGLALPQAQDRLSDHLPLASPPDISLFPTWWPRLPVVPFRIIVRNE